MSNLSSQDFLPWWEIFELTPFPFRGQTTSQFRDSKFDAEKNFLRKQMMQESINNQWCMPRLSTAEKINSLEQSGEMETPSRSLHLK